MKMNIENGGSAMTDINDIRFDRDWCNEQKFELKEDGKCIRSLDSDPFSVYCIYFNNDGFNEGIHTLSIKGVKVNDNDGDIKCCVGITSIKDKEWVNDGIAGRWPTKCVSSHFDEFEDGGWYSNDTITIKLDVDNHMVYYYVENIKSEQKLIKKDKISDAKMYHFMMCTACDPLIKYFIQ